ncbi:MAG: hypothetical protein ACRDI1_00975, partial [Actinomycetota bacterium]
MAGEWMARSLAGALSVIIVVIPGPDGSGGTGGSGGRSETSSASSSVPSDGSSGTSSVRLVAGNGDTINVTDANTLAQALAAAKPGQTIELADGTYTGKFVIKTAGEEGNPITLKGSRDAVLTGGDGGSGYDLHLDGANHWQLVG